MNEKAHLLAVGFLVGFDVTWHGRLAHAFRRERMGEAPMPQKVRPI
jgi:hypothetical protein